MLIIGLCGGSGSGKGYVCELFAKKGIAYIDTDRLYREVTVKKGKPCLNELCEAFGYGILNQEGELDRRVLADIVFLKNGTRTLNQITHKHIRVDTLLLIEEYKKQQKKAVLIDAPVLFESGFDKMCDYTICVIAPYDLRLKRILERDNITEEKAKKRMDSQLTNEELIELCDFQIENDENSNLEEQIDQILNKLNLLN